MTQAEKRYRRQFPAIVADVFPLAEGGVAAPAVAAAGAAGPLRPAQARLLTKDALRALEADPRQAVTEDAICCLICGRWLRQLTNTHLDAHETSAAEYKRRFGYNRRRPLMCLGLQRLYAERAVRVRLADHIRVRPVLIAPELRQRGGRRAIALEERLTRAEAQHRRPALAPAAELAPLG